MSFPRPDEASRAFFETIAPDDPRVQVRPMFGNLAAFVNGNMFMGVFGGSVFVRLSDKDRAELLQEPDTAVFEPMHGRPMKDYVTVPPAWSEQPDTAQSWVNRSLEWAGAMPEKKPKRRKKK